MHPSRTFIPMLFAILMLGIAPVMLHAEDIHPKLAPLKAKYESEVQAARTQRDEALAKVQAIYERALANAEHAAASARDLKAVAAIDRERKAAAEGNLAPAFPADLPGSLQNARREFLAGLAKVAGEYGPQIQKIDAEYVAQLLRIDAGSDAALQQQIATEKQRVLGSAGEKKPARSESLISRRSVVVNGDFSLGEPGSAPQGWSPAYPGGSVKLVADGNNSVLRLEVTGKPENAGVKQDVPIPEGARAVTFRARMRGKPGNLKTQPKAAAQITLRIRDAKDQMLPPSILTSKHSVQWQSEQRTFDLPAGAKSIEIVVRSVFAEGTFDFDDVSVEFK